MRTRTYWLFAIATVVLLAVASTVLSSFGAPWYAFAACVLAVFCLRVLYNKRWGPASREQRKFSRRDHVVGLSAVVTMCVATAALLWLDAPWYSLGIFLVALWVVLFLYFRRDPTEPRER